MVVRVPTPVQRATRTAALPCFSLLTSAIALAAVRSSSEEVTFNHVACLLGPDGKQPFKKLRKLVEAAAGEGMAGYSMKPRKGGPKMWLLKRRAV